MSSTEELLRKLDERLILGEISEPTYKELKARLTATSPTNVDIPSPAPKPPPLPTAPAIPPSPPAALPIAVPGGEMKVSDSVIKGNVVNATLNLANGADVARSLLSPPVSCPACGRMNDIQKTFRCQACGREHLCLAHFDGASQKCQTCARPAASGPQPPRLPLPSTSADKPHLDYLNRPHGWSSMLTGDREPQLRVKGPMPVTPSGLIAECDRLCAFPEFGSRSLAGFTALIKGDQSRLHTRFKACLNKLERWALLYPQFRADYLRLWNTNSALMGTAIPDDHFDRPELYRKYDMGG